MMEDGTPSLSSNFEMAFQERKNRRSRFKIEMKMHCFSLKIQDDALFKNRQKKLSLY